MTLVFNLPWLPLLLLARFGPPALMCVAAPHETHLPPLHCPVTHPPARLALARSPQGVRPLILLSRLFSLSGVVPTWWVYFQLLVFCFWNVLFFVVSDDYFTHDCVDGARKTHHTFPSQSSRHPQHRLSSERAAGA